MIVVATDAPLTAKDLHRLAARAVFGLGRTGASYSNGSGDFAIAFSTSPLTRVRHGATEPQAYSALPSDGVSPLFEAVLEAVPEATEEAVYNSVLSATTVKSRIGSGDAIPINQLRTILERHGVKAP